MLSFHGDAVGWRDPARGYGGLVEENRPMILRTMSGWQRNADTWIHAT
jgi:hypothetical protein